jgi:hypothetical protein
VQSQHDSRAIAMIDVQTPTDFFLQKTWRFGRRSHRVLTKKIPKSDQSRKTSWHDKDPSLLEAPCMSLNFLAR